MATYWERWEKEGETWKRIYDVADPVIDAFASDHQLDVERWRWDAPDRLLSWKDDPTKSIHILIEGQPYSYGMKVECTAWRKTRNFDLLGIPSKKDPAEVGSFQASLKDTLGKAYEQVSSWEQAFGDLVR